MHAVLFQLHANHEHATLICINRSQKVDAGNCTDYNKETQWKCGLVNGAVYLVWGYDYIGAYSC